MSAKEHRSEGRAFPDEGEMCMLRGRSAAVSDAKKPLLLGLATPAWPSAP